MIKRVILASIVVMMMFQGCAEKSKIIYIDPLGNVHIDGDIYQTGSTYSTHTEQILSKNDLENFDTLEKLQTLPWVWIKTAKVFLAVTKNLPYLAVDTHVHRVLNRVWIVKAKTPLETDKKVEKTLKRDDLAKLHHSLILFWRYICKAQNPDCKDCKLKEICNFYNKKNQNR